MSVGKVVIQHNGDSVVLRLELILESAYLILGNFHSWPAVPLESSCLGHSAKAANETTRRHGEVVLALIGALDGDGETIGDEQQAAVGLLAAHQLGGLMLYRLRHIEGCLSSAGLLSEVAQTVVRPSRYAGCRQTRG